MTAILLLNGPNLGALGAREPRLYGSMTLDELVRRVQARAQTMGVRVEAFQSNDEGSLVARILGAPGVFDGILFNPAAYTHTSVALRDALQAVRVPCLEVHLSNTSVREEFRHCSLTAPACVGQIMGLGVLGYELALIGLVEYIAARREIKSGVNA